MMGGRPGPVLGGSLAVACRAGTIADGGWLTAWLRALQLLCQQTSLASSMRSTAHSLPLEAARAERSCNY